MNITDYKDGMFYEEHRSRTAKVRSSTPWNLETVTIWAVDLILLGAVVFAHFIK